MSSSPRDRAESIRQRLRNRVRERGEDVQLALQRYAAERFLYRLGVSRHRERFVLKGAMLFTLWGSALYRSTRDLDFTGYGSSEAADVMLQRSARFAQSLARKRSSFSTWRL